MFDEKSQKRFAKTYNFSSHDINKFILSLQKGVYPYECMDDGEKSMKHYYLTKEDFYSHLNMEDITDACYMNDKCLQVYGLDTAHFLSTPRLAWKTVLKKTKVKLDLLTDINIILMV